VELEEAIGCYETVLALRPDSVQVRNNLGVALHTKGLLGEAIMEYRKAIDLDPNVAGIHHNLAVALTDKNQLDDAIAECRKAIDIEPEFAMAHDQLGNALMHKRRTEDAIAAYRKAIDVDPKFAQTHYNLGNALAEKGQLDEAIRAYRHAIALKPDYAEAHCNLGQRLQEQGQFAAALGERRKGHELGSKQPGWPYPSGLWVKEAERMVALDALLPKVLKGEAGVQDAAGLMELARFATHQKKLFAATADLLRDSFQAHPDWATANIPPQPNDLRYTNRRYAVSAAAMASAGKGDGEGLTEEQRTALLVQALVWLRAELAAWEKRLDGAAPGMAAEVTRLLTDAADDDWLAPVRDAARFAKLPGDQRDEFRQIWAASARLYAAAFAMDAKLAEDVSKGHRYNAACHAALAGCGQGSDADKLAAAERARLREQALDWLRADLGAWAKQLDDAKPQERKALQDQLKHWQDDTDLAGIRDEAALARLPAEEQKAFAQLWADVAELLKKAEGKAK
jgi:tetratricopeptide (TPR) repeat protein